MDEMIENFVEVGYLYRNKPELWKKLKLGTESANAAMREGTQHTLKAFKDNPSKYAPDKIEGIDLRFEIGLDGIDNCSQCRYDVKLKLGNKPRMVEFKSYASTTWAGIANNPKFLRQFKEYLRNVDVESINDLAYIYNPNKASLNEVKTAFREMIISKADEIFEANEELFKKFDKIGGGKIEDAEDFTELINDSSFQINHPMFNFIKVN